MSQFAVIINSFGKKALCLRQGLEVEFQNGRLPLIYQIIQPLFEHLGELSLIQLIKGGCKF